MGLFKTKVKPEPIPMEDRPVEYVRFPPCKHPADDWDCGCHSWDIKYWDDKQADLLPGRRGSTKRTLVTVADGQTHPYDVDVRSLDGSQSLADARIPPNERQWCVSDTTRIVYQVWLVVTRVDEPEDEDRYYEARLRFATKGEVSMYDEGDPLAMLP